MILSRWVCGWFVLLNRLSDKSVAWLVCEVIEELFVRDRAIPVVPVVGLAKGECIEAGLRGGAAE